MNNIDKMPVKCRDCAYWEIAREPYVCTDCESRMERLSDLSKPKPTDDYIKRSDVMTAVAAWYMNVLNVENVFLDKTIYDIPAADVEPKRKTGFWTDSEVWIDYENNARETVRCSLCNSAVDVHCAKNYCTYCGAKMLPEPPKEEDDG